MSNYVIHLKGRSVADILESIDKALDNGNAVVLKRGFPRRKYHTGRTQKIARLSIGGSFEEQYIDESDWLSWRTLVSTVSRECGMKCSLNRIEDKLIITRLK